MLDTVESETIRPKLDQAFHFAVTMLWEELRKPAEPRSVRAHFPHPDADPRGLGQIHLPVGDEAAAVMSQITGRFGSATGKIAESKSVR